MKRMIMISDGETEVFFDMNKEAKALAFRKANPSFTGKHLRDVIVAFPSTIISDQPYKYELIGATRIERNHHHDT